MDFRTRIAGLRLGLALALFLPALPAAADFKLALVDRQKALISSEKGKEAEKTLTQLQEQKKKELEPRSNACKKIQEDADAQKFVMSDDALQEKAIEYQRCGRDLERDVQAAKDELVVQQQKLLAPIAKKLEDIVSAIGKEKQFDLILDRSTPGVLYAPDALDVTDMVIKRLNEK
ncbi:MAG TPA: OmpH family outer membrane protein [Myxococcota bacterium]|nr:OmpH family outer membrane protein [Myxococcota bacterium]